MGGICGTGTGSGTTSVSSVRGRGRQGSPPPATTGRAPPNPASGRAGRQRQNGPQTSRKERRGKVDGRRPSGRPNHDRSHAREGPPEEVNTRGRALSPTPSRRSHPHLLSSRRDEREDAAGGGRETHTPNTPPPGRGGGCMRRKSLLFPTDSIPGRFPGTARKTPKARFSTPTTAGGSEQRHRDTGTAPTLSLVHLDRQAGNAPGAPQEAEARSRATGRGAQRSGGASRSPHLGGGLHPRRRRPPKGQARRVPSRQATTTHPPGRQHHRGEREGSEVGPDSAPLPSTHHREAG